MNVYIWKEAYGLTKHYHDGGGVLAVAETVEQAREFIAKHVPYPDALDFTEKPEPDYVWPVVADKGTVVIFPDAGCC